MEATRRDILRTTIAGGLIGIPALVMAKAKSDIPQDQKFDRWNDLPDFTPKTPQLDQRLVKKYVIACHARLDYVKEMLEEFPTLLNSSYDWGSGDFERGIEGAGHMGNHEIAEYLLSKGARLNIFCAAMVGNLDFVKAALTFTPSLKSSKGPHGFDLLHHAKAGGEKSKNVLEYIQSLK